MLITANHSGQGCLTSEARNSLVTDPLVPYLEEENLELTTLPHQEDGKTMVANYLSRLATLLNSKIENLRAESENSRDKLQEIQSSFCRLIYIGENKKRNFCEKESNLYILLNKSFGDSCINQFKYLSNLLLCYDEVIVSEDPNDYIEYILKIDFFIEKYGFEVSFEISDKYIKFYKVYAELILLDLYVRNTFGLVDLLVHEKIIKTMRDYTEEAKLFFLKNKNLSADVRMPAKTLEMESVNNWFISKFNELKKKTKYKLYFMLWEIKKIKVTLATEAFLVEAELDIFMRRIKKVQNVFNLEKFKNDLRMIG